MGCAQECTCKCAPLPSATGEYNAVWYLGISHIVVESIILVFTFLAAVAGSLGALLCFLASFVSLIGVSVCVCCCPTSKGWRYNLSLQVFTTGCRVVITIFLIAEMAYFKSIGDVVFIVCIMISSLSGIPFLIMSKNALASVSVLPGGEIMMYGRDSDNTRQISGPYPTVPVAAVANAAFVGYVPTNPNVQYAQPYLRPHFPQPLNGLPNGVTDSRDEDSFSGAIMLPESKVETDEFIARQSMRTQGNIMEPVAVPVKLDAFSNGR